MVTLFWILLPIAVLIGWVAAKYDDTRHQRFLYHLSLRYLLDQNPHQKKEFHQDDTLNTFSAGYEDSSTSLNLTIGDIFRNKGEIDRAISIHQQISDSDDIDTFEKSNAKWSLALDFIAAGLLDRAEVILRSLIDIPEFTNKALLKLKDIYQQQRDWFQSIACLERLPNNKDYCYEISHLYCELAEQEIKKKLANLRNKTADQGNFFSINDLQRLIKQEINTNHLDELFDTALNWLELAFEANSKSTRAHLISAFISIYKGDEKKALSSVKLIEYNSPPLIPLVLPLIQYLLRDDPTQLFNCLNKALEKVNYIQLAILKTHFLIMHYSLNEGLAFLQNYLEKSPNLRGVLLFNQLSQHFFDNQTDFNDHKTHKKMLKIYDNVFKTHLDFYPQYRCKECGFVSKSLNWHCPSCQNWDLAEPLFDIISLKNKTA